jgi:hypothetical protein
MKEHTTAGSSPETVARLLGIGLDADLYSDQGNPEQVTVELLTMYLASPPSMDMLGTDGSCVASARSAAATSSLEALLTDPHTPSDLVGTIGRNIKRMARRTSFEPERAVMTTVYFAAIAHAVAFHGGKPTTHTYEFLRRSFTEFAQKPWMAKTLADLFCQAAGACQRRE